MRDGVVIAPAIAIVGALAGSAIRRLFVTPTTG